MSADAWQNLIDSLPITEACILRGSAWTAQLRELRALACTDGTGTLYPSDPDGRIRP